MRGFLTMLGVCLLAGPAVPAAQSLSLDPDDGVEGAPMEEGPAEPELAPDRAVPLGDRFVILPADARAKMVGDMGGEEVLGGVFIQETP